ncbi:MAG: prolipoprotein diacylglyceryl transferase, partial [Clostridia bacterium]|nr:prolipoprotein diacylglyceryl transferase [Clostridia bacterium]
MLDFLAIDRVAFTLFGNPVYWYGIVITLGIILAFCLYLLLSYKRQVDFDFSLELFIWVIPMAVIFCRVFYVVPRLGDEYSLSSWQGFVEAIDISGGGLTIIGGIFGGALGVFFCCLRNRRYSLMRVADCVVIAVLLGQIIGRWGNFFNQELYGVEVTNEALQHLPFAVFIESTGKWHYASFFFEGTLNAIGLAIALVMYFVPKKPLKNGTFSIFYLGWYGLVRGTLEFIKDGNPVTFGNSDVKVVQVICYIVFVVCIVLQ